MKLFPGRSSTAIKVITIEKESAKIGVDHDRVESAMAVRYPTENMERMKRT